MALITYKDWYAIKPNQLTFFNLNISKWLIRHFIFTFTTTREIPTNNISFYSNIILCSFTDKAGSAPPPKVFISYQWDSQDEVQALWDRLERAGYSCWMDIGQLGGGDQLYNRIEHGIRNCKVQKLSFLSSISKMI